MKQIEREKSCVLAKDFLFFGPGLSRFNLEGVFFVHSFNTLPKKEIDGILQGKMHEPTDPFRSLHHSIYDDMHFAKIFFSFLFPVSLKVRLRCIKNRVHRLTLLTFTLIAIIKKNIWIKSKFLSHNFYLFSVF